MTAVSCLALACSAEGDFSAEESELIKSSAIPMRVLTIADSTDCVKLRTPSRDLSDKALLSDEFKKLSELLISTVTHPSQDGVGIAGPQVGINRKVVAVQRFDKPVISADSTVTYAFEVYPNIDIIWASDSLTTGPEGCLSVPDRRGEVARSREIVIEYADLSSDEVSMVRDTVKGFTAVIFQHEIDHLDGVLYIDRL